MIRDRLERFWTRIAAAGRASHFDGSRHGKVHHGRSAALLDYQTWTDNR